MTFNKKRKVKTMEENEKSGLGAFFQNNMDAISKLFVYHIAMCIFGLVVSIALEMLATQIRGTDSEWLSVATWIGGVFATLIYLGLIYVCMWEKGASDKIRVDGGRMKLNLYKGLYISFLANIPTIIFGAFALINSYITNDVTGLLAALSPLYNGMYTIFTDAEGLALGTYFPPFFLFLSVPALIISTVSYILGVKGYKCLFPEPKKQQNQNRQ